MKKIERLREDLSAVPSPAYLKQRQDAGWRPVAIEWQREVEVVSESERAPGTGAAEEIPFGLRVAADCHHLEEDPNEMEALKFLAELIVQDASFTAMAAALNQRGFRARNGLPWTPAAVFKLTPRLIDVAPRILSGAEWETRKKQLARVAWNS